MVEILKRKQDHLKTATFECTNCGSELRAKEDEGRLVTDRDGDSRVIECPICNYDNWVAVSLFYKPPYK